MRQINQNNRGGNGMVIINEDFYIFPEEVYRVGNSGSHKLTAIRVGEIDIYELMGVKMVVANEKGVSVFTLEGIKAEKLTGYAWLFKEGTAVEPGLKLIDDDKDEHYTLAPIKNMPLEKYKSLLESNICLISPWNASLFLVAVFQEFVIGCRSTHKAILLLVLNHCITV